MAESLKVIFFGEKGSTFSLLHYAVLCAHADVLMWVASRNPEANSHPGRQAFVSFTDWWERMRVRAKLEFEVLKLLRRPLSGLQSETPNYLASRQDTELEARLGVLHPDLIVSAGYRLLIAPRVLEIPRLGAFNCHPSPLPAYAGSNPWFWMLRNGERKAAVTIHRMVAEADAGNIVRQEFFPIPPDANHQQFYNTSSVKSAALLKECLVTWRHGGLEETHQDPAHRSFFPAPSDKDHRLDWTQSVEQICNLVRASNPAPGAWSVIHNERFVVRRAERVTISGAPGLVIRCDSGGVVIACAGGAVVVRAALVGGREVQGAQIARVLGISTGDRCDSTWREVFAS